MTFIQNLDIFILDLIHKTISNSFMDKIMIFITSIGNLGLIWIGISLILLLNKKYRKVGVLCIAALLLDTILVDLLIKNIVQRGRPFTAIEGINLLVKAPKSFSFPSGHTAASFAIATVIWKELKIFRIPVLILASLIAFSRLYLYVHYPSDILLGILAGVISANIVIYIYKKKF
ncbi:phosphatase PAP2 family protein [Clostridium sp. Marseille-Q2269]|uniref:phosphatase PAP2 family protein n=1 Tax=Clostridium sp. Marseille-Q2269 TaxID=2942205 RepID=UPI002073DAD9|nr:phosphatase PAP2 family protein [Clostridium sp. Marseille-Q2269]